MNFGLNIRKAKIKSKSLLDNDELDSSLSEKQVVAAQISKNDSNIPVDDADIYDYDAHFDDMQASKMQRKRERDGDTGNGKKARYMQVLIKNAQERRLERERIKDKRIEMENEEIYGQVETFVTESYRLKLEQDAKEKQLEKEREEMESKNQNFTGFYKGLLNQVEQQRTGPIILGDKSMAKSYLKNTTVESEPVLKPTRLNEEGEAIDKIQQLKGGLNIVRPNVPAANKEKQEIQPMKMDMNMKWQKAAQQKRQAEVLKKQKEQLLLERQQSLINDEQKLLDTIETKVTQDKAAQARERYLARKNASKP